LNEGGAPTTGGGPELADLSGLRDEVSALREHLESGEADDDVQALMDRLDELHEGLLGGDGVVARLTALEATGRPEASAAGVDADAVEEIVAAAVTESEQRLADHIDESILTLAEALLRRRTRTRAAATALTVVNPPDVEPEPETEVEAEVEPDLADELAPDDEDSETGERDPDDDDPGKRKPWWRPGG
jgi:hypothetical protein